MVQNEVEPITVRPTAPGQPRVVMFRDSFFTVVLPYLDESFGRGVYLWEDGFDLHVIDAERPDIVIQQIAQRKLMRPISDLRQVHAVRLVNEQWQLMQPLD